VSEAGSPPAVPALVEALLVAAGLDRALAGALTVRGDVEVLPSVFPVGRAATASVGALLAAATALAGSATADLDPGHVAAAFRSERLLLVDGETPPSPWDPIAGHYPVADGWVQLHTNFPHHRVAATSVLGVPADADRAEVAAALGSWAAVDLEDAVAAAGGCASALRSRAAWLGHPQAAALAPLPVLDVERVGDAPAAGLGADGSFRVLDLTRVIAGPVAGRMLAALGGHVLAVSAAHLPQVDSILPDAMLGKRSCAVDLRSAAGREAFAALVADADVVVSSYRPGALAGLGFGWRDLVGIRPGLVVVELSAYGEVGPWADRRGFDSLVQTATGICEEGRVAAGADGPVPLPCQALDHATGYLAALAAIAGLLRRREEGGSWRGRVALARTGRWLGGLGRVAGGLAIPDPGDALAAHTVELDGPVGKVRVVSPPGSLDGRSLAWPGPPPILGADPPSW